MTETLPAQWPNNGSDFNVWYRDLPAFIETLEDAKAEGFWLADSALKYLTIRVDTRDNGWLLLIDGKAEKERIDPQRVVDAIASSREQFGRSRPYARMAANPAPAGDELVERMAEAISEAHRLHGRSFTAMARAAIAAYGDSRK